MNAIPPDSMTTDERLTEVANILFTGIRRLREKQKTEKIPLDNSPTIRLYGRKKTEEKKLEHWSY